MTESNLLKAYLAGRSPEAFGRLVEQYVGLVYSSACRQLSDAHLAEDVTQAVFILLTQKAAEISDDRQLPAWLLCSTRLMVANLRREIAIRHKHEQQAAMMKSESTASDSKTWNEVAPLLDEGLEKLNAGDRDVVLLRFFQSKSLRQVGELLGVSEGAAEKRVSRAIDRLRAFFASKGVNVSSSALVIGLTQSLHIEAPTGLASAIAHGGHATGSIASQLAATKTKVILVNATKAKIAACIAGGILAAGGGVAMVQYINTSSTAATAPSVVATQPTVTGASGPVPTSQPTIADLYALKPDEPIRIVRDAPATVRSEMWTRTQSPQKPAPDGVRKTLLPPAGPFAFDWDGGHPSGPIVYAPGLTLPLDRVIKNLLQATTAFDVSEIELPADLPNQQISIPGDIVYTNTLPIDKALAGLEAAMRRELKIPIHLSVADVPRKVFVLRGEFTFTRMDL